MNNNALIKKEGIVMNSQLDFGDPTSFFSEFKYFLVLKYTDWGAKFHYYYRITGDDYIQIASGLEDKEHTICAQFKRTSLDLKRNLNDYLKSYIEAHRLYQDYPEFVESNLFTKQEFLGIIQSIKDETLSIMNDAEQYRTPFIDFLESRNMNPKPTGNTPYSWTTGCPNAEGRHFLWFPQRMMNGDVVIAKGKGITMTLKIGFEKLTGIN